MKLLPTGFALAVLLTAALPGQDLPPWVLLLARVKQHGRASFEHIPNYVFRETVKRFEKPRNASAFKPAGTESLEVASGGERGSLSLAMVGKLRDPDKVVVAGRGFAAAGVSASLVRNVFVYDNARIAPLAEERVLGRAALRYDFEMPAELSCFTARAGRDEGAADVRGTFWVDTETLDLLRIEGLGPKKVAALWKELGIGGITLIAESADHYAKGGLLDSASAMKMPEPSPRLRMSVKIQMAIRILKTKEIRQQSLIRPTMPSRSVICLISSAIGLVGSLLR